MKVLIFGASGATGRYLVSQASQSGHLVTAFVRNAAKVPKEHQNHQNIKLFIGDVTDPQLVEDAITNHEVILSALGASSPFKRDFKLIAGIQNIVAAMKKQNVKRFIYQSFLGVQENRSELGFVIDIVLPVVLKGTITDHEAKENIITASDLDWTIVRCPTLTNGSFKGKYRTGEHIVSSSILPLISRADVADFMLSQMTDKKYFYKKPRIMY
jgi:putative NADH-flavin reductase